MIHELVFRKSSYSGQGPDCVEVAHIPTDFRKSSYSGQGHNCVEVAHVLDFRKSSHSGHDQDCVKVAGLPCGAALRDSKNPAKGYFPFPIDEWSAFLRSARR